MVGDENIPAFLLKGAAPLGQVAGRFPRPRSFDDDVALAMRVHAETLYKLTAGNPGRATTADLTAAMRAALLAIRNNRG